MENLLLQLSNKLKKYVYEVQQFTLLCYWAIHSLFTKPRYFIETFEQMNFIGVGSLVIIVLTGLFTGMVLALQTAYELERYGAKTYIGRLVGVTIVRELGPVLASLMVAGRVASGIAAELGSMVVSEQVDAMRALGTDPIKKLVAPRMFAAVTIVPLLTIIADAFAITGGFFISTFVHDINASFYWSSVFDSLEYFDLLSGLSKPFFFGFIIALVGCYSGLRTSGGTVGVGRSTTHAVVAASILILAVDLIITKLVIALF